MHLPFEQIFIIRILLIGVFLLWLDTGKAYLLLIMGMNMEIFIMKDNMKATNSKNNYLQYIYIEIIISLFVSMTFFIFGPIEILLSEPSEFWFDVEDVIGVILVAALICFVALLSVMFIFSLFDEKLLRIVMAFISGIGFALYIQGNWTFVSYGQMDGSPINWSKYSTWAIVDTFLWLIIIVFAVALFLIKKDAIKYALFIFVGIMAVEIVTIGILVIVGGTAHKSEFSLLGGEEFHLSKDKSNILVICADGFDGTDLLSVFEEEPEFKAVFDGFMFYEDTVGTSEFSQESGINLLTGNQFIVGPSFKDNIDKAYDDSSLYTVLLENNYKNFLFCDEKMVSEKASSYIENFSQSKATISSFSRAFYQIYKMVAFRYMPHILKNSFWYNSMDFSALKSGNAPMWHNYEVYERLVNEGIKTAITDYNVFQFFWIQGPHEPANTDRYCHEVRVVTKLEDPNYKSAQFEQSIGVVRLFTEIVAKLKAAQVYDNTTVIFTADHGWDIRPNPLLMVKPANAHGEIQVSEAPISMIEDWLPTLEYFIKGDFDTTGTIYDVSEGIGRKRPFYVYDINSYDRTYNERTETWFEEGAFSSNCKLGKYLSPSNIAIHSVSGFGNSEINHVWTSDNESIVTFDNVEVKDNLKLDLSYWTYGKQYVEMFVNDELIASFSAYGEENRSIIIPGNLVQEGRVGIKFVLPNAISPKDANPNNGDNRLLALAFYGMRFTETSESFSVESQIENAYRLGNELVISSDTGIGSAYLKDGFSELEPGGVWTDSKMATMRFRLIDDNGVNNDVVISYDSYAFNGPQHVTVYANDLQIGQYIATDMDHRELLVSGDMIKDGVLELKFLLPDAVSPKNVGYSEDERIIALSFNRLMIRKAE